MYGAWCRVSGACRSTLWGGKSEYQLCGNITSAGWQVTLCDLIWHVRSRSAEASCKLLYSVSLYLLNYALYEKYDDSCSKPDSMTHTHTRTGEAGAGQRWNNSVWCLRLVPIQLQATLYTGHAACPLRLLTLNRHTEKACSQTLDTISLIRPPTVSQPIVYNELLQYRQRKAASMLPPTE